MEPMVTTKFYEQKGQAIPEQVSAKGEGVVGPKALRAGTGGRDGVIP